MIVEDNEGLRELLADEVSDAGLAVDTAASAEDARRVLDERSPDLVVCDLRLPGASGMDFLRYVRSLHVPPAFIVITAFGSIPQAVEALKAGADNFLTKPLDLEHFKLCVQRSLETRRLRRKVQQFDKLLGSEHFHGMIGRCRPMSVLFDKIRQVARASGPVLITGESGVGKELVAKAIHEESPRSRGPFLAVNCAGIPADLMESEFFGHAEGAFTGANRARKGLFVEASEGTLLLDEIGEMPQTLQAKLLRALQESTVRPVGSSQERPINVRVLASTNRNLEEDVEEGTFRDDLFYRLETFQLRVPPLRERGEDLDLLTAHFLNRFESQPGTQVPGITEEALELLRSYPFPGNVRELENAIERAVTFCEDDEITPEHLPRRIREHSDGLRTRLASVSVLSTLVSEREALPELEEIEERYIHYVLDHLDGNKKKTAELLGISRRTLYRRLNGADDAG